MEKQKRIDANKVRRDQEVSRQEQDKNAKILLEYEMKLDFLEHENGCLKAELSHNTHDVVIKLNE